MQEIPVIDLFAGPGGLSHGFSMLVNKLLSFRIKLSIEKDEVAYKTLRLRAFLRQFKRPPAEYYAYLRCEVGGTLANLMKAYPAAWAAAEKEAKQWSLGTDPFDAISSAINGALAGSSRWVLLGGPPCQAYSLAGRSRMRNHKSFSTDEKHTLYKEYLKIVAVHQPTVFVMENVKGILSSLHGKRDQEASIFHQILVDLRDPGAALRNEPAVRNFLPKTGYRYQIYSFVNQTLLPEALEPNDFVICSEDWGVPQRRHRVFLFGVREDVIEKPKTLSHFFKKSTVSVDEVLKGLPVLRSRLSEGEDSPDAWREVLRGLAKREVVASIPSPELRSAIRRTASRLKRYKNTGAPYQRGRYRPAKLNKWIYDGRLKGVVQHESRAHMGADLMRYLFAACAAAQMGYSLKLGEYPDLLLPKHKNAKPNANKKETGQKKTIDFSDRFRVQLRGQPATTITSHMSKDGHYYIHYDPRQCRSLTVREAARLQTFPDGYFFEGNRTQQYHQVGNAVPPLLAYRLATVVADLLMRDARSRTPRNKS